MASSLQPPAPSLQPPASSLLPGLRLNAIVDVDAAQRMGWAPIDLAAAYLNGGARFLQIRAKSLSGAAFLDLASRIREIAHAAGAILVVNDRADIARLSGADGVHVGQDDLTAPAVRAIVGPAAVLGLSTHTAPQIDAAVREPVTYIAVGPVFETSSKATGYEAVGLDLVRYAAKKLASSASEAGLVAIGGVTLDRALDVIDAGATSVAVITDLIASGDPEARVRAYVARLARTGKV
jgi:thiamine-phosphate pyrophosphorylase